ncbi:hypothetical protein POTOM_060181 (mitochondrion) [Populus tomentosa]|uniref:Uncharacterized protein n=1 Tax=Populus tomentosa TaxID=118781 RepID=A0A8X7XR67_POPTO|nr:hypothetical protein POTOM_060181 [Populus tomentosa]
MVSATNRRLTNLFRDRGRGEGTHLAFEGRLVTPARLPETKERRFRSAHLEAIFLHLFCFLIARISLYGRTPEGGCAIPLPLLTSLCGSCFPRPQFFYGTFWYVLPPNSISDPPDEKRDSELLLSRRTYPPRDSWNFCGLRWGKSTKARQIDRLLSCL